MQARLILQVLRALYAREAISCNRSQFWRHFDVASINEDYKKGMMIFKFSLACRRRKIFKILIASYAREVQLLLIFSLKSYILYII